MANNETSNASDDADDLLKKRARRRLVGAVALVLFAVITLPLVMEHQPRPTGPEIQVRIPSQDGPAGDLRASMPKSDKVSATKGERAATAEDASPSARPESRPADKVDEKPAPAPEIKAAQATDVKVAKSDVKGEAKVDAKKDAKAETKSDPKAEPQPKGDPDAARAASVLSGSADGEYVVQLGAYQEAGRVKLLLAKVKELGLPAYTEKVDTPQGPRTRVRAGPFPSKEAAGKAQERIKIIGVSGPVAPK